MSIVYTHKERTVKKFTVGYAVNEALAQLKRISNGKLTQVCTDKISDRERAEMLTIVELNEVVDALVDDTLYYDGYQFLGPTSH